MNREFDKELNARDTAGFNSDTARTQIDRASLDMRLETMTQLEKLLCDPARLQEAVLGEGRGALNASEVSRVFDCIASVLREKGDGLKEAVEQLAEAFEPALLEEAMEKAEEELERQEADAEAEGKTDDDER